MDRPAWYDVLHYRPASEIPATAARFKRNNLTPDMLDPVLRDPEVFMGLLDPSSDRDTPVAQRQWADAYGGPAAVALIAAELDRYLTAQRSYVAHLRRCAIEDLVNLHGVTQTGQAINVPHQRVSRILRQPSDAHRHPPIPPSSAGPSPQTPWSRPA